MKARSRHAYTNDRGQEIWWIAGANVATRYPHTPRYLVMHHTAGTDSRDYLHQNDRGVSCHYLVGQYDDVGINPRVHKYAGEASQITHTQFFSTIGVIQNPNPWAISIEMEGPPIDSNVQDEAATLAASIMRYWRGRGIDLLLLGHKHIDRQGKVDPALDWGAFCKTVYGRL